MKSFLKRSISSLFSLLIFLVLFNSCSIEKRQYLSGYYLDKKQNKEILSSNKEVQAITKSAIQKEDEIDDFSASLTEEAGIIKEASTGKINIYENILAADDCDTIIKKDGTIILAKITGTTESVVMYRNCKDPEGPINYVPKFLLKSLVYANGEKEVFRKEKEKEKKENIGSDISQYEVQRKVVNRKALLSMVLSIMSFFVLIILMMFISFGVIAEGGIILFFLLAALGLAAVFYLAITSMFEIFRERKRYKGFGFALTALIIGSYLLMSLFSTLITFALGGY